MEPLLLGHEEMPHAGRVFTPLSLTLPPIMTQVVDDSPVYVPMRMEDIHNDFAEDVQMVGSSIAATRAQSDNYRSATEDMPKSSYPSHNFKNDNLLIHKCPVRHPHQLYLTLSSSTPSPEVTILINQTISFPCPSEG